jgi:hypothetical protein
MADDASHSNLLQAISGLTNVATPSLLDPVNISDRVYKEKSVNLDGYHFFNCAFIACNLFIKKGNFSLNGCYLPNCTIYIDGNALRITKLASLVGQKWPDGWRVQAEADGAITIK